jgi:hypothetical protein
MALHIAWGFKFKGYSEQEAKIFYGVMSNIT